MFEATLHARDPDALLRWSVAIVAVILGSGVSVVLGVVGPWLVAVLRFVLAWLLFLVSGGPPPTFDAYLTLPEQVEIVEVALESPEWEPPEDVAVAEVEPEALLGDGPPSPPAPEPAEPAFSIEPTPSRAVREIVESKGLLVALIGTTGDSGGTLADVWSDGDEIGGLLDGLEGVAIAEGHGGSGSTGAGLRSSGTGTGGGGTAEGLSRLGGSLADVPSPVRARGTTSLLAPDAAPVTCTGRRRGDANVRWSRCPDHLRERASELAAAELRGLSGGGQRVAVVLTPAK